MAPGALRPAAAGSTRVPGWHGHALRCGATLARADRRTVFATAAPAAQPRGQHGTRCHAPVTCCCAAAAVPRQLAQAGCCPLCAPAGCWSCASSAMTMARCWRARCPAPTWCWCRGCRARQRRCTAAGTAAARSLAAAPLHLHAAAGGWLTCRAVPACLLLLLGCCPARLFIHRTTAEQLQDGLCFLAYAILAFCRSLLVLLVTSFHCISRCRTACTS